MTLAPGSRVTISSKDRENSAVSNHEHFSRQLRLLKQSSSESHAPWGGGGCFAIHQNGRKRSTSGSNGATSNTSWE